MCPYCLADSCEPLGRLGQTLYLRCRLCGMDHSEEEI